ncbi:hypothetical protein KIPB_012429, partial [Kipferlia bialata]|eukprot:g12429.t1
MSEGNPMNGDILPLPAITVPPWSLPFSLPAGREWDEFSLMSLVDCGPSCFCLMFADQFDWKDIFNVYEVMVGNNHLEA